MRNGTSLYDYDWQGNRLSATNGATGAVYAPDGLNQYDAVEKATGDGAWAAACRSVNWQDARQPRPIVSHTTRATA